MKIKLNFEGPKWKWWEYLLLIAGIVMLIERDYQAFFSLFDFMKP